MTDCCSLQVFSHDSYLCSLISRGDLNSPLVRPGEDCDREVWRHNRHWQFTHHFPLPANTEDSGTHDINQRQVLLHGSGRGGQYSLLSNVTSQAFYNIFDLGKVEQAFRC